MLLPWEYGVRNLGRRPVRTILTLAALAIVILLVFIVVGFIRGLEKSLAVSGDEDVVLVYSVNSEENIENSAIAAQIPSLLAASVEGTKQRFGVSHVSPEMYLGTRVSQDEGIDSLGLVRGVTTTAPLVRRNVQLLSGKWPGPGDVIIGRLAWAKLGYSPDSLSIGNQLKLEGQSWTISGTFSAAGSAYESEIWCNLSDLQTATRRQDLSLVALMLNPGVSVSALQLFCKERTDLELKAIPEKSYYQSLQQHYRPVRWLAMLVVVLVSAAGVFAGLNMMYGAVSGRVREFATLQALGYRRLAILLSVVQEGVLLSATATLIAGGLALLLINGLAIRFTMGAFALQIDNEALLLGCGAGLLIGVLGALPPALKALSIQVAASLKAV